VCAALLEPDARLHPILISSRDFGLDTLFEVAAALARGDERCAGEGPLVAILRTVSELSASCEIGRASWQVVDAQPKRTQRKDPLNLRHDVLDLRVQNRICFDGRASLRKSPIAVTAPPSVPTI
jgi:hypothetical protein